MYLNEGLMSKEHACSFNIFPKICLINTWELENGKLAPHPLRILRKNLAQTYFLNPFLNPDSTQLSHP